MVAALNPSKNPERFALAPDNHEVSGREWFALYTIARHEKRVHTALGRKRIESFLPLRKTHRQWKDRRVRVELPLFPGYLFVQIPSEEETSMVLDTRGAVRLVGFNGEPTPISRNEIETIRVLVESHLECEPVSFFPNGRDVIVRAGPLRGVRGRIEEKRSSTRLIISAELIQRSVAMEVDAQDLELI